MRMRQGEHADIYLRHFLRIVITLAALVFLTGCDRSPNRGSAGPAGGGNHFTSQGVDCIFVKEGYGGGLSCNWEKYNKDQTLLALRGEHR